MLEFKEDLCDQTGSKRVTKTDKEKGAFVLNAAQRHVLQAAGHEPGDGGDNAKQFVLAVPNDPSGLQLQVSYYNSVRVGAGRTPEARMGRDIVHWMEVGDLLTIANIGKAVFVWKEGAQLPPLSAVAGTAVRQANRSDLLALARKSEGPPPRQERTVSDFRRNAAVVAGAISRANGNCEMPNCSRDTFERDDGTTFLEVHHVIPLAEDGDDTMKNAAALCPTCHRELHYGSNRLAMRRVLAGAISAKEKADRA